MRNYDDEPLVIVNHLKTVRIYFAIIANSILIVFGILDPDYFYQLFIFIILSIRIITEADPQTVKFKQINLEIFNKKGMLMRYINLDNIKEIYLTAHADTRPNKTSQKSDKIAMIFAIAFFIFFASLMLVQGRSDVSTSYTISICAATFVIMTILPGVIFHIQKGGIKSIRFYDVLVICTKNNYYLNLVISTKDEYENLRDYFMQTKDIDINSLPRYVFK